MPEAEVINWSQFWQSVTPAIVTLIVTFLGFLGVVLVSAGLAIRSMVKASAGKEDSYIQMVKANNEELKQLRADLREADQREEILRFDVMQMNQRHQHQVDKLRSDYETRLSHAETEIEALKQQLADKEAELEDERRARKAAENAQALAELQRTQDAEKMTQQIQVLENQVAELKQQVKELQTAKQPADETLIPG